MIQYSRKGGRRWYELRLRGEAGSHVVGVVRGSGQPYSRLRLCRVTYFLGLVKQMFGRCVGGRRALFQQLAVLCTFIILVLTKQYKR